MNSTEYDHEDITKQQEWVLSGEGGGEQEDSRDADTPDAWVKRHPDLVRLTGAWQVSSTCILGSHEALWMTVPFVTFESFAWCCCCCTCPVKWICYHTWQTNRSWAYLWFSPWVLTQHMQVLFCRECLPLKCHHCYTAFGCFRSLMPFHSDGRREMEFGWYIQHHWCNVDSATYLLTLDSSKC